MTATSPSRASRNVRALSFGLSAAVLALLGAAACSSDEDGGGSGGSGASGGSAGAAGAGTSGGAGGSAGGAGAAAGSAGAGGTEIVIPPGAPPLLAQDCDPMVPEVCSFPMPSNVYLQDDPTGKNPSGKSVRFGKTSLPVFGADQLHVDATLLYGYDGFSPGQAAITYFPGVADTGLVTPANIGDSIQDDSLTFLVEADTGRRIPHWVDIDVNHRNLGENGLPDERVFMLRPAEHLKHGTRYLVAIRGVKDRNGDVFEPSDVFRALRDGTEHEDPSVTLRRELYADIFAKLESAGVAKEGLQIAWDYTTATRENVTGRLVAMRDRALAAVGDLGPTYVVKSVEESPNEDILRRVTLTMTVPLFLTNGEAYDAKRPETAGSMVLDDDGLPAQNGTMEWDVVVHIPNSIGGGEKHGLLQNGHGLFGGKGEGQNGYLAVMANRYKWIAFSVDFFGFAGADVDLAIKALVGEEALLPVFMDRQHQGHVNQLLAMRMMMGRVAQEGIVDGDGNVLLDPAVIDRDLRAYRGDSQGGIMGTTYMAISTDVTRGLLGEPGLPYSLLLNRSADWPGYGFVLDTATETEMDVQIMLSLIQMAWDRTEPSGYVSYLASDPLPGTPEHRVLIHPAIGDHQVTTFSAHILARATDAKLLTPPDGSVHREVYGLEKASGPLTEGSAMVEFDFDLAPEPLQNIPPRDGCDPHDRVRVLDPAYEQQDEFFRTGVISWKCDGLCNCDYAGEEVGCERTREPGSDRCER